MYKLNAHKKYSILWTWLFVSSIVATCLLSHTINAHAYGLTECTASRFGDNLNCTAQDVSITNIRLIGDTTSCTGGTNITADLEVTVNFATPDRWDIGVFISNDGKSPQLLPASGGANSCSVAILPPSSPFLDLDGVPKGTTDTCGDGNKGIGGGTGNGILYMTNVTVLCQAISGSSGNLYIPFVVSWDNQASPAGLLCTSIADPVPNTKSKCNAPTIAQGTVSVVVMPTITKTDGITTIKSGNTTNYTVVITNTTGVELSNAVFKDPAVTNINVNSVSCTAAGGASCPSVTVADMQGSGITIPTMPVNSSVTFTINATLIGNPGDTRTNTASVTVAGQTSSASDTDTIVGDIAILPTSLSKYGSPGTLMVFNYTVYNFSGSTATISLSASSNKGWTVQLSTYSVTLSSGGSANFTLTVQIPSDASVDPPDVDTTTITATSSNPATAITTVLQPLTLTPDNTGSGGKGSSAFYDHRVQNNTASIQTVTFSTISNPCGWTVGFYESDKVTPVTVNLAAFGGYEDIVVKINIPAGAATGSTCAVTVRATSSGGNTDDATDTTTVKDIVLYSDAGYTKENYIYPAGNPVYARAYGTLATNYKFYWYDSNNALKRTSPIRTGPGILSDTYDIPAVGPFGTWRVEVRRISDNTIFAQTNFYVGPDHISAGNNLYAAVNSNAIITLTLHDRYNHVVPLDPSGNVVQPAQFISVTVSGSATIVSTTLTSPTIIGQTVTGYLRSTGDTTTDGTATITITDSQKETVTITPNSTKLVGSTASPDRDESITVTFVRMKMRVIRWREVVQ